jgi:hypothetical protein
MTRSIQYRLNRSNTDTSLDPDRYANTRIVARPDLLFADLLSGFYRIYIEAISGIYRLLVVL